MYISSSGMGCVYLRLQVVHVPALSFFLGRTRCEVEVDVPMAVGNFLLDDCGSSIQR